MKKLLFNTLLTFSLIVIAVSQPSLVRANDIDDQAQVFYDKILNLNLSTQQVEELFQQVHRANKIYSLFLSNQKKIALTRYQENKTTRHQAENQLDIIANEESESMIDVKTITGLITLKAITLFGGTLAMVLNQEKRLEAKKYNQHIHEPYLIYQDLVAIKNFSEVEHSELVKLYTRITAFNEQVHYHYVLSSTQKIRLNKIIQVIDDSDVNHLAKNFERTLMPMIAEIQKNKIYQNHLVNHANKIKKLNNQSQKIFLVTGGLLLAEMIADGIYLYQIKSNQVNSIDFKTEIRNQITMPRIKAINAQLK